MYLPTSRGFDEYCGIPFSQDMGTSFWQPTGKPVFQPTPLPVLNGTAIVEQPAGLHTLVARYVAFAEDFIARAAAANEPFYLYVPFNHVHAPNSCGAAWCGKASRGPVGDAVEETDWAVGQIMAALKAHGVDQNTLTFFSSDNGAPLGKPDGSGRSDFFGNLPLRGGKTMVWEGGVREPGIVRWPGKIAAGSVNTDAIVSTLDIHPTLLGLANVALPTDRVIDGIDLMPILTAKSDAKGHDCFFVYRAAAAVNASGELFGVRCGDHKAYYATNGVAPPKPFRPGKQDPPLLFNLVKDPGENHPLDSSGAEYKAALATIDAAKARHLATITPVPDQNGRGSSSAFALCENPESARVYPHLPNCTSNPENWRPASICASKACLKANPAFSAECKKKEQQD